MLLSTGARGLMECGSAGTVSAGAFTGDKAFGGAQPLGDEGDRSAAELSFRKRVGGFL